MSVQSRLCLRLVGAATAAILAVTPASAAEFLFNFSGNGFFGGTLNGTGTITTNDMSFISPTNGFTAQSITGDYRHIQWIADYRPCPRFIRCQQSIFPYGAVFRRW